MTWTPTKIQRLRARLGLTQAAFAARLGVSITTVSRWENNHTAPTPLAEKQLNRIAVFAKRHKP